MVVLDRDILLEDERAAIVLKGPVHLGTWGMFSKTVLEAPIVIGASKIETSYIGAFSQINIAANNFGCSYSQIECESIGRYCSIADGVRVGTAGHSTSFISSSTLFKFNNNARKYFYPFIDNRDEEWENEMASRNLDSWKKPLPVIGNDVWIGMNAIVLNGVHVGNGAVIAAGSVVVKDIEPYSIVGGNPARTIRKRFSDEVCQRLNESRWWNYNPSLLFGLDLSNPERSIDEIEKKLEGAEEYHPPHIECDINEERWIVNSH